jgi:signal transduction histidine kinase
VSVEAELRARVAVLETERRRVFDEAQREADTMFAQYQLSQLVALGDSLGPLADAVLAEIGRATGAGAAALWLAPPGGGPLGLAATIGVGLTGDDLPSRLPDAGAAQAWAGARGWFGVALEESHGAGRGVGRDAIGFVAVAPAPGAALDPAHARYLGLVRRELGLAFRAAQLRDSLAAERAALAAILEGASDAIIAVDTERRVVRLNAAATHLVGRPAREAVGGTCDVFLGCGEEPAAAGAARLCGASCPFAQVLETGHAIPSREEAVRHRDGTEIPVSASYAPMAGPNAGAVAVFRDLRADRALDDLKSSFIATISHELRTPLALISGHAQSLLHLDLDAEARRRHLVQIGRAVERLATLVDEVMDISHIESDGLALHRRPVDLAGLLHAFAAEQAELPGMPPVTLDLADGLPLVDADPARLHQVLANLATNTAKYAGRGARITIRARRPDAVTAVVTFADDGRGIPPDEQENAFQRFSRGRAVRESRVPGSGLGLYICRRLVEAHGGWIRLDATTRGTSISFGLPVAPTRGRGRAWTLDQP